MDFTVIEFLYILLYFVSIVISILFVTKFIIEVINYKKLKDWILILIAFLIMFSVYFIDYTFTIIDIMKNTDDFKNSKVLIAVFYMISFILLTIKFSKFIRMSNKHGKDIKPNN